MAVAADSVAAFLSQHAKIKAEVDSRARAGKCWAQPVIQKSTGTSDADMKNHLKLFEIDEYHAKAMKDTYCPRDAIRVLEEKLGTALV